MANPAGANVLKLPAAFGGGRNCWGFASACGDFASRQPGRRCYRLPKRIMIT